MNNKALWHTSSRPRNQVESLKVRLGFKTRASSGSKQMPLAVAPWLFAFSLYIYIWSVVFLDISSHTHDISSRFYRDSRRIAYSVRSDFLRNPKAQARVGRFLLSFFLPHSALSSATRVVEKHTAQREGDGERNKKGGGVAIRKGLPFSLVIVVAG